MIQRGFEKTQKSFGGTFIVPSHLYVLGSNVLEVSLVVLVQRASIDSINQLYSFFHPFQVYKQWLLLLLPFFLINFFLLCPSSRYSHFVKRRNKIARFSIQSHKPS